MALLALVFFLTFVLFSIIVTQCYAFVTSMSRGVYQPNRTIIFDERTFQNPRLLYALCDSSNKCRLEHDREPFERPTDACQVNLQTNKVIDKIRVIPFGKDKAILIWMESSETDVNFNLAGVRFGDCSSRVVNSSFDYNKNLDFIFQPSIATYENYYNVLFVNTKLCGDKYCKMTVDFETNKIQGPTAWIPVDRNLDIANFIPMSLADDGLLAIQFSGEISIIRSNDRKVLKKSGDQSNKPLSYSTSNNFIGVCELVNNNLNCSQFDHLGVQTFESTSPIDPSFKVKTIYNLSDGGIIILLIKPSTNIRSIIKLDAQGRKAGRLDLRIRCGNPHVPAAQFFEKGEKLCVSLACFDNHDQNKNNLEVAARCFSSSDIRSVWK